MNPAEQDKLWPQVNFEDMEKHMNGESQSPLHELRKKAIHRFQEMGFPTLRQEAWRFTNIAPIRQGSFQLTDGGVQVTHDDVAPYLLPDAPIQLVFVNGSYRKDLSQLAKLEGVEVQSLGEAIKTKPQEVKGLMERNDNLLTNEFSALNAAFVRDGAYIRIDDRAVLEKPIHLLYLTRTEQDAIVVHPRNLIVAGAHSQSTLLESYIGWDTDLYFNNPATDIFVGENAGMEHYKLQRESDQAFHIANQHIYQSANSRFASWSFSFGASISRNDIHNVLDGQGCDSILNGLYLVHGVQLVDTHSLIDHAQPHCHSREEYHGILDDKAKSVFSGKILVRKDAQKTDAIQSNKNIMLSEEATVDTQPQLEIFADDVRCTHGGTVGQIDENGVFYLRSRGIDKVKARNMMIHAFAGEIFNEVKIDSVREMIDELVLAHLHEGHLKHETEV